jgi:hypothetical protein
MIPPSTIADSVFVALDGSEAIPRSLAAKPSGFAFEGVAGLVFADRFAFPEDEPADEAALCWLHGPLRSAVGFGPTEASARTHDEPEGVPEVPLPSELLAASGSTRRRIFSLV